MQRSADSWLAALRLVDLTCRLLTICGAPAMKQVRPDAPDNRKYHQLHDGEEEHNVIKSCIVHLQGCCVFAVWRHKVMAAAQLSTRQNQSPPIAKHP